VIVPERLPVEVSVGSREGEEEGENVDVSDVVAETEIEAVGESVAELEPDALVDGVAAAETRLEGDAVTEIVPESLAEALELPVADDEGVADCAAASRGPQLPARPSLALPLRRASAKRRAAARRARAFFTRGAARPRSRRRAAAPPPPSAAARIAKRRAAGVDLLVELVLFIFISSCHAGRSRGGRASDERHRAERELQRRHGSGG
jgi:hypothetical protein